MGVDGKGRRLVTRLNIDDLTEHTGLTLAAIARRTGRQRWEDLAACRGRTDLDFFPPKGATKRDVDPVIQTCARCDVRMECAMFALVHNIGHGIWGGTSENQRRRLRADMDAGRLIVLPDIPPPIPPLAEPITRAVCGTRRGAHLHRRNKERYCDACAAAEDRRRAS